jgi:hypothetical protein
MATQGTGNGFIARWQTQRSVFEAVLFFFCLACHAPVWVFATLIVAEFYLTIPFLLRTQPVFPYRERLVPFVPGAHPHGAAIVRYFEQTRTAIEQAGFVSQGLWQKGSPQSITTSCIAMYRNPAGEIMIVSVQSALAITAASCFIYTLFADGTRRNTTNGQHGGAVFPQRPRVRGARLPQVQDPARLLRLHRALIARLDRQPIAPFPDLPPPAFFQAEHDATYAFLIERGYVRRDDAAQGYARTLYGAAIMGWKIAPPIGTLRKSWFRWRATRLLRELGDRGDARPIIYEPATQPRTGEHLLFRIASASALYAFAQIVVPAWRWTPIALLLSGQGH